MFEVNEYFKMAPTFIFRNVALDQSSGIEEFGQPKWDLVLCLMFAWIICFLCLIKGIKSTGKVTIHIGGSDVLKD